MFNLNKAKNWSMSSIADDKRELNAYQQFQDCFSSINNQIDEYISEKSYEDERLQIVIDGKKYPLSYLDILENSIQSSKDLGIEEKIKKISEIEALKIQKIREIRDRIINLAVNCSDNKFLSCIQSTLKLLNRLLITYAGLTAIRKSGVRNINNEGIDAAKKIKSLEDEIEIRIAQINSRIATDTMKRH